jgi:hypothetical protein
MFCKIQTHPLVREGSLLEEANKCKSKENLKSGHELHSAAKHQDQLADCQSQIQLQLHNAKQNIKLLLKLYDILMITIIASLKWGVM